MLNSSFACLKLADKIEKETDHFLFDKVIRTSSHWVFNDENPTDEEEEAFEKAHKLYVAVDNLRERAEKLALEEAIDKEWERLETRLLQGRR